MITVKNLTKCYPVGDTSFQVLKGIDLEIAQGEFVAVMGPSGSGKSTFLNLLGGLDTPDSGEVLIEGNPIHDLQERQRTLFRRKHVGFVFQNYQLLPTMTVEENIAFPMEAEGLPKAVIAETVASLVKAVHLQGKEGNFPSQLSGGQQQRVSIARALSMKPRLILADEPTGNLDRRTGTEILDLLLSLQKNEQLTIIMVTHDVFSASYADRIILLKDGVIETDIKQKEGDHHDVLASILAQLNA
ncbi:ABC transporter ATP-binding protein [Brevibacillus ruminantium]|uniref:ABC transporter ATP-binding protein n=1 Tax=Brevibacillus ruminantium TaxID=2950604 RepID=A0ABY4WI76_9BACL|nr:ABC transporter ATP-binding protein [Brevibacillus ruminantium]USG66579.1 ABC transporter ATP-binding protein [Brevibacillus ruminantium]